MNYINNVPPATKRLSPFGKLSLDEASSAIAQNIQTKLSFTTKSVCAFVIMNESSCRQLKLRPAAPT